MEENKSSEEESKLKTFLHSIVVFNLGCTCILEEFFLEKTNKNEIFEEFLLGKINKSKFLKNFNQKINFFNSFENNKA